VATNYSLEETRAIIEIALRNPDPGIVALALRSTLALSASPVELIRDALDGAAGEDVSDFFNVIRRYGHLEWVLALFEDVRPHVRQAIVAGLRWIWDPEVLALLERAIDDPDAAVSATAAKSLETVRSGTTWTGRPFDPLSLTDAPAPDGALIAFLLGASAAPGDVSYALSALGTASVMRQAITARALQVFRERPDVLFEALDSCTEPPSIALIAALGQLGDTRAIPYLLRHGSVLRSSRPLLAICDALVEIGGDDAAHALIDLLARGAYYADYGLKKMGRVAAPHLIAAFAREPRLRERHASLVATLAGPAALNVLIAALSEPDPHVRREAESALFTLGEDAVTPLLGILASGYLLPRASAIQVLARLATPRGLRPLLEIAADASDPEQHTAVTALAFFRDAEAVDLLERSLRFGDARLRSAAALALSSSDQTENVSVLFRAASDANPAVRLTALAAIAKLVSRRRYRPEAISILEAALSDPDPLAVRTAERALDADRTAQRARDAEGTRTLHDPGFAAAEHQAKPPQIRVDEVAFSAVAPDIAASGEEFLIDFWVHLDELTDDVVIRARAARGNRDIRVASKRPIKLGRETVVLVRLSIPTFGLAALEETIIWTGRIGNTSFPVTVPRAAAPGTHLGCFSVFVGPLQISQLRFELAVGPASDSPGPVVRHRLHETRVRSAFVSYATEDRSEVLARVQGMLKVIPDLDLFVDVLDLRSGDHWEERIRQEISARDMFYLFWSVAASRSPWVEREWRTALELRGLDYIDPVPLQSAIVAPPPAELAALHFNEWTLAFTAVGSAH